LGRLQRNGAAIEGQTRVAIGVCICCDDYAISEPNDAAGGNRYRATTSAIATCIGRNAAINAGSAGITNIEVAIGTGLDSDTSAIAKKEPRDIQVSVVEHKPLCGRKGQILAIAAPL